MISLHKTMSTGLLVLSLLWGVWGVAETLAATLQGSVSVEGGKKLRNLVVYLEPAGASSETPSPKFHKVSQKGRIFQPPFLVVTVGDTVQYLNNEKRDLDHNIYSLGQVRKFDLGLGGRGSMLEITFIHPGKVNYFCSVHKRMEGRLLVVPSRHFTVLKEPGDFSLAGIPEGKCKLQVYVIHRRYKFDPVVIEAGSGSLKKLQLNVVKK